MPLFRTLKSQDWTAFAIELVLIFVGITAALWFDNWNENRERARIETVALEEMREALATDLGDLTYNLGKQQEARAAVDTVLAYLDERRPYHTDLPELFTHASQVTNFIHQDAPYEYLQSVGLDIISNDTLRAAIARYYSFTVTNLQTNERVLVNPQWQNDVKRVMLERFEYGYFFSPSYPHDYDALFDDRLFRSVLVVHRETTAFQQDQGVRAYFAAYCLRVNIENFLAGRGMERRQSGPGTPYPCQLEARAELESALPLSPTSG